MQAADPADPGALYERYSSQVYRYVYNRVANQELAEDLTSMVFVKALLALRAHRAWKSSCIGWLCGIARNAIWDDCFRRPQQGRDLPLDDELASPLDMEGGALDAETVAALRAAMRHLTAGQGQAIVLCYGEGMSNVQVAEAMHTTEGAVKGLRRRAIVVLREQLEEVRP